MTQECVLSHVGDACRWSSGFDWPGFLTALLVVKLLLVVAWLLYRWRRNRRVRVEGSILPPPPLDVERTREWIRARMRDV